MNTSAGGGVYRALSNDCGTWYQLNSALCKGRRDETY